MAGEVIAQGQIEITMPEEAAVSAAHAIQAAGVKAAHEVESANKDMAKATIKAAKDAAAAQEKAAKEAAREVQTQTNATKDLIKKAAESVGGPIGMLGNLAVEATEKFGSFGLAAGLGAGAAGQALVLAGAAYQVGTVLYGLADGTVAARDELNKLGYSISDQAEHDIKMYERGSEDLTVALDNLQVDGFSGLASEIGVVKKALGDNLTWLAKNASALNTWGDSIIDRLPGLSLLRDGIRYGESSVYHALTDTTRAILEQETAWKEYGPTMEQLTDSGGPVGKMLTMWDKLAKEAPEVNADIAERLADETAAAERALHLAVVKMIADWKAVQAAMDLDAQFDAIDAAVVESQHSISESLEQSEKTYKDYTKARNTAELDAATQAADAVSGINQAYLDYVDSRLAAGENLTRGEAKAANSALAVNEAIAIGQAGIQATMAGLGMIANLSPFIGPAAIPVGIGIASGLFAASVAGIVANQPFKYSWKSHAGKGSANENDSLGNNDIEPDNVKDGDPHGDGWRNSRGSRGRSSGMTLTVDPRLARLEVRSDRRVGKRRIQ